MSVKNGAAILSIKAKGDDGVIEGYASTFGGEPDSYGDVIAPGAYTASLAAHKAAGTLPKLFWQHNRDEPIGKWLEMSEDDKGLVVKGRLNMGVQRGREAYELLKSGDIDGLSIGYRVKAYSVDAETNVWTLEAVDLLEVSVVSIGANTDATIETVKTERTLEALKEKLATGDRLSMREFETLLKGSLGLSNSQAERAARLHLKAPGEPADAATDAMDFLEAMRT